MALIIKELVVKVVVSEKRNTKDDSIDIKLQKHKKEILNACLKMIRGKHHGR